MLEGLLRILCPYSLLKKIIIFKITSLVLLNGSSPIAGYAGLQPDISNSGLSIINNDKA